MDVGAVASAIVKLENAPLLLSVSAKLLVLKVTAVAKTQVREKG
jgi:hypothetical protein